MDPDALFRTGAAHHRTGQSADAEAGYARAWYNLGNALREAVADLQHFLLEAAQTTK
jgi:hypothetical protein